MKINLNKIYPYYNLDFILLFLSLFSVFFLWDIKNNIIDFRFSIIIFSIIYFFINFKTLNFKFDYLITSVILFILIHYNINVILKDLSFDKNIIFFSIYILISYYYLNFQKIEFSKIFERISIIFLVIILLNILLNFEKFALIETTSSGACGLFTNFSNLNFKIVSENSHFGMVASGAIFCILYSIKENEFFRLRNILFYILILILCFSVFSMTLLLGIIVGFIGLIFSLNKKNYRYFIIPTLLVVISISSIGLKESCLSRIERINFLKNIDYMNTKKNYQDQILKLVKNFNPINNIIKNELQKKNDCPQYNELSVYVNSMNKEIESLEKKTNFNLKKMGEFKNSSDELFSLQMETKKMKDKKDVILEDVFQIIDENLLNYEIFSKCNISISKKDLDLKFQSIFNKEDFEILELNNLQEKLYEKGSVIKNAEDKYSNPNLTTQVYQIALFNTYSSIKENPLGWGYNNYAYSHFKYVIDNMVRLNLDTKINSANINLDNNFNVIDNIQDPDVFYLNYNDGRNNFSKLITEFGYLSIILFIFLIVFGLSKKINLIEKSFLIPIIGTQLGSGAGYTNGGFAIAIILALIIYKKSVNKI